MISNVLSTNTSFNQNLCLHSLFWSLRMHFINTSFETCAPFAEKRRKTIWSECRIVSPFKCKACEPPPNLRSALLDTLKNECFSITKILNSKKLFNCNYFHTHFWILWGLFLNYVKIDQMVQDVKLFSLAAIFYIYLNGK